MSCPRGWAHLPPPPRATPSSNATDAFAHLLDPASAALRRQLQDEARYTRLAFHPMVALQTALYDEMAARLPDVHVSPVEPLGDWHYYTRTARRRDLPCYVRRRVDGGPEQVLLDLGALADRHGYAGLGSFSISADQSLMACTVDLSGRDEWELRVIECASGRLVSTVSAVASAAWAAAGEELVYTSVDARGRPSRALCHTAGGRSASDTLLYEEVDESATLDVALTKGRRWLTLTLTLTLTVHPHCSPSLFTLTVHPQRTQLTLSAHPHPHPHPHPQRSPSAFTLSAHSSPSAFTLTAHPHRSPSPFTLHRSPSPRWLTLTSSTICSSEVRLVRADAPRSASPLLVSPRQPALRYYVEDLTEG